MDSITWSLQTIPITKLKEWSGNPRKITEDDLQELKNSFTEFGHARTLTVCPDGKKFCIIGGNQSKKALSELGITEIQCSVASRELSDDEKKKLSVFLNHRNKGEGEWDFDVLESWDKELVNEWGILKPGQSGYFQQQLINDYDENQDIKLPYPITIVVDEKDYVKWEKIKKKYGEDNNLKLFLTLLNEISG